jgi:hypothetical protein
MLLGTNIGTISLYRMIEILLRRRTRQFRSNRNTARLSSTGVWRIRLSQEPQCVQAPAALHYKQSDSRVPQTYQFNSQWDDLGFGHDRSVQGLPSNAPQQIVSIGSGCHLVAFSRQAVKWNTKECELKEKICKRIEQ